MDQRSTHEDIVALNDDFDLEELSQSLPTKVASTIFDCLFLDGNKTRTIAKELTGDEKAVHDAITGGELYGTTISKPWFGPKHGIPFSSIKSSVHGSIVNATDRHTLDCLIATGKLLPPELIKGKTLKFVIAYISEVMNKQQPNSFEFDHAYSGFETNSRYNSEVFDNSYYYYVVDAEQLLGAIPLKVQTGNRARVLERMDKLGLAEFRLQFLDEDSEVLTRGKFKLLHPSFFPILNLAKYPRQRKQIKPTTYSHIIVGVSKAYIHSLKQHSAIGRKELVSNFAGITTKANLQDFVKWLFSNQTSYIKSKSIKKFITKYYEEKAYSGKTYITTKVNATFTEFIAADHVLLLEKSFGCTLWLERDKKNKVVDASLTFESKVLEHRNERR